MGAFIAKQPNGRYCRFSTVVDCVTDYNMTYEDYINNVTGTVCNKEEGIDVLEHYLRDFSLVSEYFRPINMTAEEFKKILKEMTEEAVGSYKLT